MSSEWISIADLLQHGDLLLVQDGNHGGSYPSAHEFVSCGVPLITGACLINGRVEYSNAGFISESRAKGLRVGLARAGDVLLTHKGTMGKTAIVPVSKYPVTILNPQITLYRLSPSGRLDSLYLRYFFDSAVFQKRLIQISATSTISTLPIREQKKLEVPLPSLKVQKAITEILGVLDDRITLLRETNATLEAIAQALFKSWFVDFDPVRAKMEGRVPEGMDDATAALFPDGLEESELGLVPRGWRVSPIGNAISVVDFVANGSFASLKENVTLQDVPSYALFLRTTDFNSGYSGNFRYVDEKAYSFLSKSSLDGSEVVISNVGDVGTVFRPPRWLGLRMTLGSNAIALKAHGLSAFMYFYFSGTKGQQDIKSIITGSAQLKFNKTNFRSLLIGLPEAQVLMRFESVAGSLLTAIDNNLAKATTLATLRDTLLPRLISGQLRLPEAVEQLADLAVVG